MMIRPFLIAAAVSLLAGCKTTSYCEGVQPYQNAPSIPPVTSVQGLTVPNSRTALHVPENVSGQPVGYSFLAPDPKRKGKTKLRCLDQPPPIPPPSELTK